MKITNLNELGLFSDKKQQPSKENEERYERLEKEHLGDWKKGTGIYSRDRLERG